MEENKQFEEVNEEIGIVRISDEVVSIIAGLAASEINGIIEMSSKTGEITQLFPMKKNVSKGVKVTLEQDSAMIDLHVVVEYGVNISEISYKVQNNVKRTVESMTGLNVSAVNIYIQNVILPKPDKEEKKEQEV
ncbi:Asp23/Gls24 family envelope stress response protein [Clostridium ihumii]|uniref:Asp23/Gls24 family envelope stress response protein n=1 Tax=Clostridium ihumii TaxID=1470356 RepID=UPI00058CC086|nr:Asp23/Gls24 family envelope stress response protein [Clostridium ihumii]